MWYITLNTQFYLTKQTFSVLCSSSPRASECKSFNTLDDEKSVKNWGNQKKVYQEEQESEIYPKMQWKSDME